MSQIDDLFRDGLGARKADVSNTDDLWARINAAKGAPVPEGEALDTTFRQGLRDRQAAVPAGMWQRIAAARGRRPLVKWFAAAAALLLLLTAGGIGYQMMGDKPHPGFRTETVAADHEVALAPETTETAATGASDQRLTRTPEGTSSSSPETIAAPQTTPGLREANPVAPIGNQANEMIPVPENTVPPTTLPTASGKEILRLRKQATVPLDIPAITNILAEEDLPTLALVPGKFKSTRALRGMQTELLFGASYANQEFTLNDESATNLRTLRQNREYPKAGYQITLRTTYRFNERLQLQGGLTYAEIRNEVDYQRTINGQSVLVSTNNQIRMLEAPLLAGYTIPGRRMNVTVNAGPVLNLTTGVQGRFVSPDSSEPLDLRTDGNYRNNVGVGFTASLTTAYQIGKKRPFTLLIEPFFKAYPTAFTVRDAPLRENYWVAGLQFGIRKSL